MAAPSLTAYFQGLGSVNADNLNTFEQTCDTIAQLRAFTGVTGVQVYVRGGTAIGDGGGGLFYWNATLSATDNGVTVIVPSGSTQGAWVLLNGASIYGGSSFAAGSGNYTTPANSSLTTVYRYRLVAGGGGGGGSSNANGAAGGGGAGCYLEGTFTGVAPGTLIPYTVGAGGVGGTTSGTNGGNGANSLIGAPVNVTAGAGSGGIGVTSAIGGLGGPGGGIIVGPANLLTIPGGIGGAGLAVSSALYMSGAGGNSSVCQGGTAFVVTAGTLSLNAAGFGGGGAGAGGVLAGGNGGGGFLVIERFG